MNKDIKNYDALGFWHGYIEKYNIGDSLHIRGNARHGVWYGYVERYWWKQTIYWIS